MSKGKTIVFGKTKPVLKKTDENIINKFYEAVETITNELERVEARKEKAERRVDEIENNLSGSTFNILSIENPKERSGILKEREVLEEELKEEKLYLNVDVEAYLVQLAEKHKMKELHAQVSKIREVLDQEQRLHLKDIREYQHEVSTEWRDELGIKAQLVGVTPYYNRYIKRIKNHNDRDATKEYYEKVLTSKPRGY